MSKVNIAFIAFMIGGIVGIFIHSRQTVFSPPEPVAEVAPTEAPALTYLQQEFGDEYGPIIAAAVRNGCSEDDTNVLFAIRKAENGPAGHEFGIMCQKGTDLDTQAGWAAATIVKNRGRWGDYQRNTKGGRQMADDFITFLGKRYCPDDSENWVKNVKFWVAKIARLEFGRKTLKVRIVE